MHAAMASVEDSGSVDVDFVRLMLPHHQAAIDMAKTHLLYGKALRWDCESCCHAGRVAVGIKTSRIANRDIIIITSAGVRRYLTNFSSLHTPA